MSRTAQSSRCPASTIAQSVFSSSGFRQASVTIIGWFLQRRFSKINSIPRPTARSATYQPKLLVLANLHLNEGPSWSCSPFHSLALLVIPLQTRWYCRRIPKYLFVISKASPEQPQVKGRSRPFLRNYQMVTWSISISECCLTTVAGSAKPPSPVC